MLRTNSTSLSRISSLLLLPRSLLLLFITCIFTTVTLIRRPPLHPTLILSPSALSHSLSSLEDLATHYRVVSTTVQFSRYARLYDRRILLPNASTPTSYDILGRVWRNDSFRVVSIVPFSPQTKTFTLLREYNPAAATGMYTFPQGQVEGKHADNAAAASAELGEEARLSCAPEDMVNLVEEASPQDKHQREMVMYYLCVRAVKLRDGRGFQRDEEERIEVEEGVNVALLKALIAKGKLQSNNIASALLAIDRLRLIGLLPVDA